MSRFRPPIISSVVFRSARVCLAGSDFLARLASFLARHFRACLAVLPRHSLMLRGHLRLRLCVNHVARHTNMPCRACVPWRMRRAHRACGEQMHADTGHGAAPERRRTHACIAAQHGACSYKRRTPQAHATARRKQTHQQCRHAHAAAHALRETRADILASKSNDPLHARSHHIKTDWPTRQPAGTAPPPRRSAPVRAAPRRQRRQQRAPPQLVPVRCAQQ